MTCPDTCHSFIWLTFRFYWKIIHDPINAVGVAVVGVNNIHLKVSLDSLMIHLKTEVVVRVYLLIMTSAPSWRITRSWTMSITRMTSPGGLYGPAGGITHITTKSYCSFLRVEDLAAAIPNVPDLSPMDLLQ